MTESPESALTAPHSTPTVHGEPKPGTRVPQTIPPKQDEANTTQTDSPIPADAIRHGTCGNWWTGASRAHCGNCHRTFSSLSAFDSHQRGHAVGQPCADPAKRGLVAVAKKYGELWSWPGRADGTIDEAQVEADAEWYGRLVGNPGEAVDLATVQIGATR